MGKVEGDSAYMQFSGNYFPWHGHVTALTVAPQYRRLGLARTLTGAFERGCEEQRAWFVDLFVREGNDIAVGLYRGSGSVLFSASLQSLDSSLSNEEPGNRYSIFRRVINYYNDDPTGRKGGEDAFDMRKPLSRDKKLQHIRPDGENHRVNPEDLYRG